MKFAVSMVKMYACRKADQDLQQVDEQGEAHDERRRRRTDDQARTGQDEDQRDEGQDHHVPRHHVGEQADAQREGLDQHAQQLERRT